MLSEPYSRLTCSDINAQTPKYSLKEREENNSLLTVEENVW